ncbi:MAG: aminotransferase class IV [Halieaceae bacterium]|jgi:D-alanine transaminase
MAIAFLNGDYLPLEEARISPMDRGFLFGDGIYEVIPSYGGRLVGFDRHTDRLCEGLGAIGLSMPFSPKKLHEILTNLLNQNSALNSDGNLGLYLQITRGEQPQRNHRFPDTVRHTSFAFPFSIPAPKAGDPEQSETFRVITRRDLRWSRCHIKSVSLLGNVLHMMEGVAQSCEEILLFNDNDELTEASTSNVFIVKDGEIYTPPLDHQKLGGITRNMLIDILRDHGTVPCHEMAVSREQVATADEVWLSSSTKELSPVTEIDGCKVGSGGPGPFWSMAQSLLNLHRFDY